MYNLVEAGPSDFVILRALCTIDGWVVGHETLFIRLPKPRVYLNWRTHVIRASIIHVAIRKSLEHLRSTLLLLSHFST